MKTKFTWLLSTMAPFQGLNFFYECSPFHHMLVVLILSWELVCCNNWLSVEDQGPTRLPIIMMFHFTHQLFHKTTHHAFNCSLNPTILRNKNPWSYKFSIKSFSLQYNIAFNSPICLFTIVREVFVTCNSKLFEVS